MLEKIKERVKAWKCFYTQECKNTNENSSWCEILTELEYYRHDRFRPFSENSAGQQKLWTAIKTIGTFSNEEKEFLETLPAYHYAKTCLKYDDYNEYFRVKNDDFELFCMCRDSTVDVPIREYTIITDRQDLWGLEIYIFKVSLRDKLCRHGIIRYAKEPPADYAEPNCSDDLPF